MGWSHPGPPLGMGPASSIGGGEVRSGRGSSLATPQSQKVSAMGYQRWKNSLAGPSEGLGIGRGGNRVASQTFEHSLCIKHQGMKQNE